jgi:hypothetical protein
MKLALAVVLVKHNAIAANRVLWMFALVLVANTSCVEIAQAQLSPSLQLGLDQQKPLSGIGKPNKNRTLSGTYATEPPVDDRPHRRGSAGTEVKPPPPEDRPPDRLPAGTDGKPPVDGRPPEREPAGTRGSCEKTDQPFTPLLPVSKSGFSGYTLTEHPTFWFYVPYKITSVTSGKFSLQDEEGNTFYRTSFKLPNTPGFVSVSVPTTEKPLEKNKTYNWKFTLSCASQDSEQPPQVWHMGTVQRVDMPALETQLKTANLEERTNLYIKNNIWYDASTDLAKVRESPQAWRNLLKAIGLEQLAQEPIVGSVDVMENK